jgi:hypothetical protein
MGFLITQLRIGGSKRLLNFVLILALALIAHSDMVKSEKGYYSHKLRNKISSSQISLPGWLYMR